jgi:hypothetical protein
VNITANLYGISVPLVIDIGGDGIIRNVSAPNAQPKYQRMVEVVCRNMADGKSLIEMLHRNAEMGDLLRLLLNIEEKNAPKSVTRGPNLVAVK